jgi:ribosomal protein S17
MDKTIVVAIERRVQHPVYGKMVTRTTAAESARRAQRREAGRYA